MTIAISSVQVPFIKGGATLMTKGLQEALQNYGHKVEIITMPFKFFPIQEVEQSIDNWLKQDFTSFNGISVDKVISLQFPSFYVSHPNKVLWLMHQHRLVYELFDEQKATDEEIALKDRIRQLDTQKLSEYKKIYTISKNVSKRVKKYNDIDSTPLYHPPFHAKKFYTSSPQNFIFFPSRLEFLKRQSLVIEAFRYIKTPLTLILAGDGSHKKEYEQLISKYDLSHKVKLLGEISEEEKIHYFANSLAVVFPPYDEDYGYVTLEAMLSSKPVITCNDSGGVLEFVKDKQTGFILPPDSQEIAQKIDWLYHNKQKAIKMGQEANSYYFQKDISWEKVVKKLLEV